MKKQFILSSIFSILLVGNCTAAQAAYETMGTGCSTVITQVFQDKKEVAPEFPGGFKALVKFLSVNLRYPTVCRELKIQGKVLVKFTVKADGTIANIRITKSVDTYLDKEAIRVVKSMPRWNPGTQEGKPVNMEITLPINFKL